MMLYDVLKASKGLYVDDSFAMLWGKQLGGWTVSTITGTLPLTFRSNGTALINYRIFGTKEGSGAQTENLFDKNATDTANGYVDGEHLKNNGATNSNRLWAITEYIPITGGHNYTFNYGSLSSSPAICYYDSSKQFIQGILYGGQAPKVVKIPSNVSYIRFSFMKSYADVIMLVQADSLPTTYIPYGLKLPLTITSETESKTADVYIGDSKLGAEEYVDYESGKIYRWADITGLSEPLCGIGTYTDSLDLSTGTLTRRIKKLVLTGTISDGSTGITAQGIIYITPISTLRNIGIAYCTHYQNVEQSQSGNLPSNSFTTKGGAGSSLWFKTDYTTIADFQSYLAAQYAAGTPVTVWYVLAEPETSTIPVPSGLTGTIEGYLIQDDTPTPETPIYPTAYGVKQTDGTYSIEAAYLQPTDPPLPFPELETFKGENTLDSTETLGQVTITGKIKEA